MIFLWIAGGLGIFQILLILSEKASPRWAEREALTEARRHGVEASLASLQPQRFVFSQSPVLTDNLAVSGGAAKS